MRTGLLAFVLLVTVACPKGGGVDRGPIDSPVTITGLSPRTFSNQTSTPLLVFGRGLTAQHKLRLGAPFGREIALVVDDAEHASARLPADLAIAADGVEVKVPVSLVDAQGAAVGEPVDIVVVNDTGFTDVYGLVVTGDGRYAFTTSQATDELFVLDTQSGAVSKIATADAPWAIAITTLDGAERVVVAHRYASELVIVDAVPAATADGKRAVRRVPAPSHAHALAIREGIAYVGEHAHDQLVAVDLKSGDVKWRADVAPNPRGITIVDGVKGAAFIAVGSLVAGETTLVSIVDGSVVHRGIAPRPVIAGAAYAGTKILGGHTESYADRVMGGKGVRALIALPPKNAKEAGRVLVASSGPNVGPNKDQMGVTTVGGVGVIELGDRSGGSSGNSDATKSRYAVHLAFNFGVPQAFALDAARGRLWVADVGQGLIHVVDTNALANFAKDEKKARASWLGSYPLPLPDKFPLFREREDFSVEGTAELRSENATMDAKDPKEPKDPKQNIKDAPPVVEENLRRRAGVEVHTGPSALALTSDAKKLYVLERFTARITRLDVATDVPVVEKSFTLFDPLVQVERRLGQVLYFADMGRTGMTCDTCHLEGHTEGVFFTKTGMMRIWRSSTIRGVRDTPPYFNPPGHATIEDTCSFVGSRNRFQNPPMSGEEARRLALFAATFTTLPNPFRAADGGLAERVVLDGGRTGSPKHGRGIFEGRCAGCHPAPMFSTDQDDKTRRRFMKVGTPPQLDLRESEQDVSFVHRTPPSLIGAWDNWPMLLSATAGFHVASEGPFLEAVDHSALRAVLDRYTPRTHGDAMGLSPEQRADLEAYVQSL